jgi:2,4-didehydro-3-deoxy-L-rhamnonate hydrolase
MAINIIRFEQQNQAHWGVLRGEQIAVIPGDFRHYRRPDQGGEH